MAEKPIGFNYIEHYKKDAVEFDYFEERKGATLHDERRVHEYILSRIDKKAGIVLDTGCGSAWLAETLTAQGLSVVSTDIALANLKKAKMKVPVVNHHQTALDSFNLPFNDKSFDYVVASEVIEHVPDPGAFIKELSSKVKPGGKLIITTPYKEKLQYVLCIHCNEKTPVHAHIHSFDENKLIGYFSGEQKPRVKYFVFGNKYLIFARTYVLLQFLPFSLWKLVDRFISLFLRKDVHILIEYTG